MKRFNSSSYLTALILGAFTATTGFAEQAQGDAKLRETLRNTMLQLRTMQGERDALQVEKTQLEQDKQALTQQKEALSKQLAADKDSSDKAIAELKDKVAALSDELTRTKDSLAQWQDAQKKAAAIANAKEAERAKLAGEKIELQRKVADQQTKNLAMFKLGNEILTRYEKFGLGTAITAREPFIGTTRVKLENLVQDYQDKLNEQRIRQ